MLNIKNSLTSVAILRIHSILLDPDPLQLLAVVHSIDLQYLMLDKVHNLLLFLRRHFLAVQVRVQLADVPCSLLLNGVVDP